MSAQQEPKPQPLGRPKQPYCPDCRRNGNFFVPKKPGQGYCRDCHSARTRRAYQNRMKESNPSYAPRDQAIASTLHDDIKAALAKGMPLDVTAIQNLYSECGQEVPTEAEVQAWYFDEPSELPD